ncbi:hypothetical protein B0A48_17440 [Cryoendolithus antarcticus]|uniref:Uncharacterized protein n=1 Tax=Cryoendolithus antarcticus TaxID=1507870 RepID=A0A1V8SCM0_9PEZI|nr:hypothetical protein B0A48_17440 [Cryoendolithus antarcticus]
MSEAEDFATHSSPAVGREQNSMKPRKPTGIANTVDKRDGHGRKTSTSQANEPLGHGPADTPSTERSTISSTASTASTSASSTASTASIEDSDIRMRIEKGGGGMETYAAFKGASKTPPITPDSLSELDMPRIINNPKLRHDVNFDRELHFRPNLDGSKGKEKIKAADQYWKALEPEVHLINIARRALNETDDPKPIKYWHGIMTKSRKRLRKVFEVVRDILKTLVPDADQSQIEDRLDVDLLFQQIDNGMCDLVDLANWLATVIKKHCAPMRDNSVDEMQKAITEGALKDDQTILVNGLRLLLLLLENMKLDVANHQIRAMRPLLIADTITFQQRYNAHRISIGKLDKEESRAWLEREHRRYRREVLSATPLDSLTHALLWDLIFADSTTTLKPTFYLDIDRLRTLRLELHSSICLRIVLDLFHELCDRVKPSKEADATLTNRVDDIVGVQGLWLDSYQNIAVELVRSIQQVEVEDLSEAPEHERIEAAERRLLEDLPTSSEAFNQLGHETMEQLLPRAIASIDLHYSLSAADLQEALVPPLPLPTSTTTGLGYGAILTPTPPPQTPVDPDLDLINRFTHIVVLHWQVWSELVYLAPQDEEHEDDVEPERRRARGRVAGSEVGDNEGSERSSSPSPAGFVECGHHLIPSSGTAGARSDGAGWVGSSDALDELLSLDGEMEGPDSPEVSKDANGM